MLHPVLAAGFYGVPWNIIALLVVVAIGLFLIRAAFTLIKVLIVVAIGVAIYFGITWLVGHI